VAKAAHKQIKRKNPSSDVPVLARVAKTVVDRAQRGARADD
jgi:hypothetical protein